MTLTEIRQWTIDEYYRIADAGILNPNERVASIAAIAFPQTTVVLDRLFP